jgi:hypothetical protein
MNLHNQVRVGFDRGVDESAVRPDDELPPRRLHKAYASRPDGEGIAEQLHYVVCLSVFAQQPLAAWGVQRGWPDNAYLSPNALRQNYVVSEHLLTGELVALLDAGRECPLASFSATLFDFIRIERDAPVVLVTALLPAEGSEARDGVLGDCSRR